MIRVLVAFAIVGLAQVAQSATVPLPYPVERVLLPITVTNANGAFGTVWSSELWLRIDSDSAHVYPLFVPTSIDPPTNDPIIAEPASSFRSDFLRTHTGETEGSFFYVGTDQIDHVHISLRLNETSGKFGIAPLQLPVVRATEFSSGVTHILGIPVAPSLRLTLRVYGNDPALTGTVAVLVFDESSSGGAQNEVGQTRVALTATPRPYTFWANANGDTVTLQMRPPTARLDLTSLVPPGMSKVRVELVPDAGLPIWGFVSITDDSTQQVLLRTPN